MTALALDWESEPVAPAPPGERIARLEEQVAALREIVSELSARLEKIDGKADQVLTALNQVKGGKAALWTIAAIFGAVFAGTSGWLTKKLGI